MARLSISAVWCHWCHIMDETMYSDPHVIALINDRCIAVRVDNDRRPDDKSSEHSPPRTRAWRARLPSAPRTNRFVFRPDVRAEVDVLAGRGENAPMLRSC
ncbi:MAG: hypothetical protein NVSMB5_09940 [Candidatus Velthaea sp.]